MASLTVLNGLNDHQNLDNNSNSSNNSCSTATYLLTTSVIATTTTQTTSTTKSSSVSKIAPKRQRNSDSSSSNSAATPKRRSSLQHRGGAAPAVARRNERERNRVRQVNMGFATLRQHVPNGAKSKKMSKVETLRSAVQYIKQLQQLLNDDAVDDADENSAPSLHFHPSHLHSQQSQPHLAFQTSFEASIHLPGSAAAHAVGFGAVTSPGCSAASSPTPSLGSEAASSPYDSLSPEDEELLDFTTWLS